MKPTAPRAKAVAQRQALQRAVARARDAANRRVQAIKRKRAGGPRDSRRTWRRAVGALVLLALLALARCACEPEPAPPPPPPSPPSTPMATALPPPPKPAAAKPERAPQPRKTKRPRLVLDATPTPTWIEEYRMQVAARSARLASCLQGGAAPGRIRWTATLDLRAGAVADHVFDPLGGGSLDVDQRACLAQALSDPRYLFRAPPPQARPERVTLVVEF